MKDTQHYLPRGSQIKPTMTCNYIPVRMAKIQEVLTVLNGGEDMKKEGSFH